MNLKIADYFGIPLYLNVLTIPFSIYIYHSREDVGALALAIFFISLFFVLLHEYGHCFMARWHNWHVLDITILPIGGVAQIHFKYDDPSEELQVVLAGPAVNLFFVMLFLPLVVLAAYYDNPALAFVLSIPFIANTIILLFNLLPVFPMDGGRVLRALLSYKIGHERATWWAVRFGQISGFVLSMLCLYYGLWFAGFIFLLMMVVSQNELASAKLVGCLHRIRIKVAWILNKPELNKADLPELIAAIESVEDKELIEELQAEELLILLRDLKQSSISI